MTDDVLLGVRQAREAFAAAHGYDLRAMAEALRRMDEEGDWPVVRLAPRRPEVTAVRTPDGPPGKPSPAPLHHPAEAIAPAGEL